MKSSGAIDKARALQTAGRGRPDAQALLARRAQPRPLVAKAGSRRSADPARSRFPGSPLRGDERDRGRHVAAFAVARLALAPSAECSLACRLGQSRGRVMPFVVRTRAWRGRPARFLVVSDRSCADRRRSSPSSAPSEALFVNDRIKRDDRRARRSDRAARASGSRRSTGRCSSSASRRPMRWSSACSRRTTASGPSSAINMVRTDVRHPKAADRDDARRDLRHRRRRPSTASGRPISI